MSEEAQLKIHMMGKISAEYNGKSLPVGTALSGRVLQLFLILLYYHDSGISREELLDMMYGSGEYANPAGSLRAVVFRLRRIMEECLPAGEHIQTEGGVYRWVSKSVSVYVDARDFQATAEKGLEKENEEELLRACELYQGEFLAQLAGEKWVTIVSVRCQELYFRCLRSLSRQMQENREYQSLLNIVNNACQLYPYEECQIMKMDCLIAMKRFREAMQVYKWVVRQYFEEQGLPPSEKMLERFRTMSSQIRYTTDMLKDVRESLKERDAVNGPYYCSYPSFIDSYRLLNRLSERISFEKVLICIFFVDIRGKACVLLTQKRQGKDYEFEIEVPIVVDSDMLFEDSRPTYANIKKYVFDKYGVRLQQRDIAVVKRDCGIKIKVNKHLIEGDEPVIRKCTPDKRKYIIEALKYYHAI